MSHHIVLTGVESTFKSALAKALGDYLALEVVDEYARTFLEELDDSIDMNDLLNSPVFCFGFKGCLN